MYAPGSAVNCSLCPFILFPKILIPNPFHSIRRCTNGGTCIDGVDEFHCSCPTGFVGSFCECLLLGNGTMDCNYTAPTGATTSTPFYSTSSLQTEYTSQIFTHDIGFWTTTTTTSTVIPHTSDAASTELPTTIVINEETIPTTELFTSTTLDASNVAITKGTSSSSAGSDGVFGDTTTQFSVTRTSAETATTSVTDDGPSTDFLLTTLVPNTSVHGTTRGPGQTASSTDYNVGGSTSATNGIGPIELTTIGTEPLDLTPDVPKETTTVDGLTATTPTESSTMTTIQSFFTESPDRTTLGLGLDTFTTDAGQYSTIKGPADTTRMPIPSSSLGEHETTTTAWTTTIVINRIDNTTEVVDCMKASCWNGGTCVTSSDGDKVSCVLCTPSTIRLSSMNSFAAEIPVQK